MVLLLHLNLDSNTDDFPSGIDASTSENDFIVNDVQAVRDVNVCTFGIDGNQSCYCSQYEVPISEKVDPYTCIQTPNCNFNHVCELYTKGIIHIGGMSPMSLYELDIVGITSTDQELEIINSFVAATTNVTVPGAIEAPVIVESSDSYLEIQWTEAIDNGGSEVTFYQVFLNGFLAMETSDGNILAASFTNVDPDNNYTVTVAAVNSIGAGPQSDLTFVTMSAMVTLAAPNPLIIQQVSGGMVKFAVQDVSSWNSSIYMMIEQRETVQADFTTSVTRFNESSITVYRLVHDTIYVFRAYFVDAHGIQSDYSESIVVETGAMAEPDKTPVPALMNVTGIQNCTCFREKYSVSHFCCDNRWVDIIVAISAIKYRFVSYM